LLFSSNKYKLNLSFINNISKLNKKYRVILLKYWIKIKYKNNTYNIYVKNVTDFYKKKEKTNKKNY